MEFEKWYEEVFISEQSVEPSREIRSAVKFAYSEGFYKATESMQAKLDEKDKELENLRMFVVACRKELLNPLLQENTKHTFKAELLKQVSEVLVKGE
jgi:hypothetical protein